MESCHGTARKKVSHDRCFVFSFKNLRAVLEKNQELEQEVNKLKKVIRELKESWVEHAAHNRNLDVANELPGTRTTAQMREGAIAPTPGCLVEKMLLERQNDSTGRKPRRNVRGAFSCLSRQVSCSVDVKNMSLFLHGNQKENPEIFVLLVAEREVLSPTCVLNF